MTVTWTEETRLLSDLNPFDENPRRLTKNAYDRLLKSIKECGYNNRLLINTDNTVMAGHQRIRALKELGYSEVKVLVPNRLLSDTEFKRVLITDNLPFGEFDFDILANNFDVEALLDWGLPAEMMGETFDDLDISDDDDDKKEKIPCKNCPYKGEK